MKFTARHAIVPAYLTLCLLFGGASAAGIGANAFLQLLALPIIAMSFVIRQPSPLPLPARQLLVLCALMLGVVAIQLIPLPPSIWTALPGRSKVADGFALLGQPLPWLPISLAPYDTIASVLWLLPAIAVLAATLCMGAFKPAWIAVVLVVVTIVSIALGAVQRAGGQQAYIYEITNYGVGVGFFSNANHLATLLLVTLPFLTALYVVARTRSRSTQRNSGFLMMFAGTAALVLVGLAINGSLAGAGLCLPVLALSGVMTLSRKRTPPRWAVVPIVAVALIGVGVVFSAPLGNNLTTTTAKSSSLSRHTSFANSLRAAGDFFPLGSGVGTFADVYPTYENPDVVDDTYMNHAHSDFIELLLETGLPGYAVLGLFLAWWCRRAWVIWNDEEIDQFARAATIASGVIIAHSLVDYPLRTAAISAVFAACCALMAETRPWVKQKRAEGVPEARHLTA